MSPPKAIPHWDGGMELMKWRIAKSKLMVMRKMRLKENDNICKRALMNEIIKGTSGLSKECKDLAKEFGLQYVRFTPATKGEIKRAVEKHSLQQRKAEKMASRKVGDRTSDKTYLSYMTLANSKVWMSVRARLTKGVKMNHKRSHLKDLSCSICKGLMEESQEHLEEECPGCEVFLFIFVRFFFFLFLGCFHFLFF